MTRAELAALYDAAPPPGKVESGARGVAQGLTAGFLDEAAGGLAAVAPFLDPEAAKGATLGERYRAARDFYRAKNKAAETANPGTYLAGQVGGAVAPLLVGGAAPAAGWAKGLAKSTGQGLAQGAGYSEATDAQGLAADTALGGALGAGGYGAGRALGVAASKLAGKATGKIAAADAATQTAAAVTKDAEVRSVEAAARERAANAYRQVERIEAALNNKATPAADRAALEAFKQTPEYADVVAANVKGILGTAPDAAAELAAAKAVAQQARQDLPQAIQTEATRLGSPAMAKEQIGARLKRYGPVWAGGAAGALLGGPAGSMVGMLAGAGSRPSIRAVQRMIANPAVQKQIWGPVERGASAASGPRGAALLRALGQGAGAGAAAVAVGALDEQHANEAQRRAALEALWEQGG